MNFEFLIVFTGNGLVFATLLYLIMTCEIPDPRGSEKSRIWGKDRQPDDPAAGLKIPLSPIDGCPKSRNIDLARRSGTTDVFTWRFCE